MFRAKEPEAHELDEGDIEAGWPDDLTLFRVRPYKDTPGFDSAVEFIRGLDASEHRFSVEAWFDEARVKFIIGATDRGVVEDVVTSVFPNSVIERAGDPLPPTEPGEFVAGARLHLRKDCVFPIRHADSVEGFEDDPYQTLLPKLVDEDENRVVLQVVARPEAGWYERGVVGANGDRIGEGAGEGRLSGQINPQVIQTKQDKAIKKDIQAQRPRAGYRTALRVLVFATDGQTAESRVQTVCRFLEGEYTHVSGQGFDTQPLRGKRLLSEVAAAAQRTVPRKTRVARFLFGEDGVLTDRELAALAHLPSAEINVPDVDWSRMESGPGAPPASPTFDYDPEAGEMEGQP